MNAEAGSRGRYALPRGPVVAVVAIGLCQAAALVGFIFLLRRAVTALIPYDVGDAAAASYRDALLDTGALALVAAALGVLRAWEFSVAERAGYEVVRRLRMEMYEHLTRMMPQHLRHRARGGLLLRLTGDLSMLRMWLSRGLLQGGVAVMVLVAGLATVAVLNVWIACALTAALALTAAVSVVNGQAMRNATRTMRRRRSLVIGNIDEQINSLPVVQTGGRVGGEYARLSRQNDALNRALCRVASLRGRLRGLATWGAHLSVVFVLAAGLVEVHAGATDAATVVTCLLIARLVGRPVRTLGLAHDYWHRAQVSRQKVDDFLRSSARGRDEAALEPLRARQGDLELHDVTVTGALDSVSATVPRRTIVAITGPCGAGQSTLMAVLARQVDPDAGHVVLDGRRLQETSWTSVGRSVGVVGPDLPLMRGTVLRNLSYRRPEASAEELQRVALSLGLDDSLNRHGAAGLLTWVTEGGASLTAGDRQLVKVGRAMVGNPAVLLLDGPTEGLDPAGRARVREVISRYQGTVLLVSNDPEDVALADVVWRMDAGRLVEAVTAEEYRDRQWLQQGGISWDALAKP